MGFFIYSELGTILVDKYLPDMNKQENYKDSTIKNNNNSSDDYMKFSLPSKTDKSIIDMHFGLNLKPNLIVHILKMIKKVHKVIDFVQKYIFRQHLSPKEKSNRNIK